MIENLYDGIDLKLYFDDAQPDGIEDSPDLKQEVSCGLNQKNNTISFNTGQYDTTKELVIQPV